jgi:Helix-turn-helix domain
MKKLTQEAAILMYLKRGKGLTPLEALSFFGCLRLAARCHDLRNKGYPIKKTLVTIDGATFARYRLVK